MKVKYEFTTESVDVEVDEIWGEMLMDMDRREYNNDHKETRRHASLDELNLDDAYLPSDSNVEDEIIRKEDIAELGKAFELLTPEQFELLEKVYFEGRTMSSIARVDGVSEGAIRDRLKRIHEKIKKSLK